MYPWNKGIKTGIVPKTAFKKGQTSLRKGVKLSLRQKEKIRKSKLGVPVLKVQNEKHPKWKGEEASYSSKHHWIRRKYDNPLKCEDCGKDGNRVGRNWSIEWSNNDHLYCRNIGDYRGRCKGCHKIYDLQLIK